MNINWKENIIAPALAIIAILILVYALSKISNDDYNRDLEEQIESKKCFQVESDVEHTPYTINPGDLFMISNVNDSITFPRTMPGDVSPKRLF